LVNKYPDRYINTIYIDDPDFESVRDNLAGISDRMKARIRWYDNSSPVKLEKKIRKGRLGKKKIFPLDLGGDFSSNLSPLELRNRVQKAVFNCVELNDAYYAPVLGVRYLRKYFEDRIGLRVTFDEEIQFSDLYDVVDSFPLSNGLVNYRQKIMELKFDASIKDYVTSLIKDLNMTPKRHSKYLVGLAHLGKVSYI
jgi:hypothetical protein